MKGGEEERKERHGRLNSREKEKGGRGKGGGREEIERTRRGKEKG